MRRRANANDWLVMGGALLWLVAFFLPWYHTTAPGLSLPIGGNVAGGLRWVLFVLALAVLAFGVIVSFELVEVNLAASNGLILLLAGAVLSIATLVYAVWPPTGSSFSYGVWLSLLGGLAITYGGFASHNAESSTAVGATSRPDLRWTPQPPAPSAESPSAPSPPQVPSHPPRTAAPTQSPEAPSAPPTAPPSQPPAPGFPQQPTPPGYPHGHGRGYGGGPGEGW